MMKIFKIYFNDGSMYEVAAVTYERACAMACEYNKLEIGDITRVSLPDAKPTA